MQLHPKIMLFADDSVQYGNIRNQNDRVILQNDLDTISSWSEKMADGAKY